MPTPLNPDALPTDGYIYKHSTACPVSGRAAKIVEAHAFDQPLYWVNVIEERETSNRVAEHYGVQHQSPQLLKIEGGQVVQNLHHFQITDDAIG